MNARSMEISSPLLKQQHPSGTEGRKGPLLDLPLPPKFQVTNCRTYQPRQPHLPLQRAKTFQHSQFRSPPFPHQRQLNPVKIGSKARSRIPSAREILIHRSWAAQTQKSVSRIPESRHNVSVVADRLASERPGSVDPWSPGGVFSFFEFILSDVSVSQDRTAGLTRGPISCVVCDPRAPMSQYCSDNLLKA